MVVVNDPNAEARLCHLSEFREVEIKQGEFEGPYRGSSLFVDDTIQIEPVTRTRRKTAVRGFSAAFIDVQYRAVVLIVCVVEVRRVEFVKK